MNTKTMILSTPVLAMATLNSVKAQSSFIDINEKAPVKCEKSIIIQATPEEVWAVMTNVNQWPAWQTEISNAQIHGKLEAGTKFTWKTGGAKIHSVLHTVEKAKLFGWTGKTFGMRAIHNWKLEAVQGGTIVKVSESLEGVFASVLKKSFNKSLEKGMLKWLELLKSEVEKH